jgi:hypothetical protein
MRLHVRAAIAAVATILLSSQLSFGRPNETAAATLPPLTTIQNPGGGLIVTGSLGSQSSPQSATVAMLSRIHDLLGARPNVIRVAQNLSAHSITLFFTDTRDGKRYTGISMIDAAPGSEATGAALYDRTERFPKTIGPMLRRLATRKAPTGTAGTKKVAQAPLAAAEPLIEHQFSDGTGSMGVPADWTLKGGGGGSAVAVGPTGKEIVNFNFTQSALEPSSTMGQMLVNGTGIYPPGQLRENGLKSIVLLRYSGDPVEAWTRSWSLMAKQAGRTTFPSFVVRQAKRTGPRTAFVFGSGAFGDTKQPFAYLAYLNVTPPSRLGQWAMYFNYVIVPMDELVKEGATASAVLSSVRINFAVLNDHIDIQRRENQRQFESEIANDRALDAVRQAGTDASIARANANADAMRGQAVAMQHYVLGTSVVSLNGVHSVPLENDLADALVQADAHYQIVRPSELIKGVDY